MNSKTRAVEHVDSGYGVGALGFGRLLLDRARSALRRSTGTPKRLGSGTAFKQNARAGGLGAEALHVRRDALPDDVVAEDDDDPLAIGEVFGKPERSAIPPSPS